MIKDRLLTEFNTLNCITNLDALHTYIEYCITNSLPTKIIHETSAHHILPRAKTLPFTKFSDLKIHPWNKVELYYYNHYYAHYLLTLAVNHIAILNSFVDMHIKDFRSDRVAFEELIDEKTFNQIYIKRNQKISEYRRELIIIDSEEISRASYYSRQRILSKETKSNMSKRMAGNNNIVHLDGVVDQIRKTKLGTIIDGKNLDTISAERAAETMKKLFKNESGEETTIYQQAALKHSKTLNDPIIDIDGTESTLAKKYGIERSKRMRDIGKWYILYNIFDDTIKEKLSAIEIRSISPGLEKCNKENYLGKSKYGQSILTKKGKSNLIGLFVERLL